MDTNIQPIDPNLIPPTLDAKLADQAELFNQALVQTDTDIGEADENQQDKECVTVH